MVFFYSHNEEKKHKLQSIEFVERNVMVCLDFRRNTVTRVTNYLITRQVLFCMQKYVYLKAKMMEIQWFLNNSLNEYFILES